MNSPSKHHHCLICQSSELLKMKRYYPRHGLVKCGRCGFVFMEKIPSETTLREYYATYAYQQEKNLSPITLKRYQELLQEFEPYRRNNRILEIGCGQGDFLQEAQKNGWETHGTEFSAQAVEICRKRRIHVYHGKLHPHLFPPEYFDVIISIEVIEHINNPQEEMQYIASFLRKGGLFYCTTPNFNSVLRYYLKENYSVIHYPEHLCYYTPTTLQFLFAQNGFRTKKILTTGISINRIRQSCPHTGSITERTMNDEKIRAVAESSHLFKWLKRILNFLLNITRSGMTIKGYFEKL